MGRFPRGLSAYCERIEPGFWGEPLNTLSNIGFFIAAYAAFRLWRKAGQADGAAAALIFLCACIGIGSTAFHAFPTRLTLAMDVVPIQIFILFYLGLALRRYFATSLALAFGGVVLFMAASFALVSATGPRVLLGGIGYVPALLALFGFGGALMARAEAASRRAGDALVLAGGVFALSLTARTLDLPLCELWPYGLHPLWHALNALVLFVVMRAAIRHGVAPMREPI